MRWRRRARRGARAPDLLGSAAKRTHSDNATSSALPIGPSFSRTRCRSLLAVAGFLGGGISAAGRATPSASVASSSASSISAPPASPAAAGARAASCDPAPTCDGPPKRPSAAAATRLARPGCTTAPASSGASASPVPASGGAPTVGEGAGPRAACWPARCARQTRRNRSFEHASGRRAPSASCRRARRRPRLAACPWCPSRAPLRVLGHARALGKGANDTQTLSVNSKRKCPDTQDIYAESRRTGELTPKIYAESDFRNPLNRANS